MVTQWRILLIRSDLCDDTIERQTIVFHSLLVETYSHIEITLITHTIHFDIDDSCFAFDIITETHCQ